MYKYLISNHSYFFKFSHTIYENKILKHKLNFSAMKIFFTARHMIYWIVSQQQLKLKWLNFSIIIFIIFQQLRIFMQTEYQKKRYQNYDEVYGKKNSTQLFCIFLSTCIDLIQYMNCEFIVKDTVELIK